MADVHVEVKYTCAGCAKKFDALKQGVIQVTDRPATGEVTSKLYCSRICMVEYFRHADPPSF